MGRGGDAAGGGMGKKMSYTNHANQSWQPCPLCGRRTHLAYMAEESFEFQQSFGFSTGVSAYVECSRCRLELTEYSMGRDYKSTIYALKRKWNTRGGERNVLLLRKGS